MIRRSFHRQCLAFRCSQEQLDTTILPSAIIQYAYIGIHTTTFLYYDTVSVRSTFIALLAKIQPCFGATLAPLLTLLPYSGTLLSLPYHYSYTHFLQDYHTITSRYRRICSHELNTRRNGSRALPISAATMPLLLLLLLLLLQPSSQPHTTREPVPTNSTREGSLSIMV